ncbi:MAG: DUF4139 domain-containing protein [Myxococcaceae bacterium]|nr:MAG: DUF4139 domain-containing protein [Myxococcaceae bacterium]
MAIHCDSSITHVQVFARGARVTRRVVPGEGVAGGEVTLAVDGLPTLAAPGSFRVSLGGDAAGRSLVLVRSSLVVPAKGSALGPSLEAVRELERKIHRIDRHTGLSQRRRDAITEARLDPKHSARRAPDDPRSVVPRTRETLAAHAMLTALAAELDARLDALHRERHELVRALERARTHASQARSSELTGDARPTRRVLITVRGDGPLPHLELTYAVDAARWWPVYTLRIRDHARAATWISEALVAQRSGEDWRDARLELSTADMLFDARLPTLPSLRFGRAQPPPKRAFRAAPGGVEAMFEGYDRAYRALPEVPSPAPAAQPLWAMDDLRATGDALAELDEDVAMEAPGARGEGGPPTMPPAPAEAVAYAPQAMRRSVAAPKRGGLLASAMSFGGGGAPPGGGAAPEPVVEPSDAWLDYDGLTMGAPGEPRRGKLGREGGDAWKQERDRAVRMLDVPQPPAGAKDPLASRGMFDHRYRAEGLVEVPSDGLLHRVPLGSGDATPTVRWRVIACESTDVFREVELRNPFDAPLLAGPVDVYVEGSLLVVAAIQHIDRGGTLRVGMGVDERLRTARNVRAKEDTAGLLGGDTIIDHTVSVELSSALGSPALVEVVDRVPVTDEKTVEVTPRGARPEPERFTQAERGAAVRGGLRWEVIVPAGGRAAVEFSYRLTIPSKNELVGGNRRG